MPRFTKIIPASLAAIVVDSAIVLQIEINSRSVGNISSIQGGFPPFHIPVIPFNIESLQIILPYAAIVAGVGLIESLKTINKMPLSEVLVIAIVATITVLMHNLVIAVLVGLIISALVFSWENARRIRAKKFIDENGIKHYELYNPIFFASVTAFNEKFDVPNDLDEVIIDFSESRVKDKSAIETLNKLTERYHKLGKKLHLKHLSSDCRQLLHNADEIIDLNILEDPTY